MKINKLNYHLMPKKGWLNDPNGLVYFKGEYHIFYQADEESLLGHVNKAWGHYSTKDFITYKQHELAILPDSIYDKNGAYSGSAIVKDDVLYLFYTGNVKHEGNYDYITSGREQNLMRVESKDGIHFTNKVCLLYNEDYPNDCSNHVRDPKIFVKEGQYHLALGARLLDNTSCVLEYVSNDLNAWTYLNRYTPKDTVGYMIECPDYLCDKDISYIVCSPQGLLENNKQFQNRYACGYYKINQNNLVDYQTLDYGFDFYAPQTFYGTKSNVMIGWIGMPDNDYIDFYDDWNQTLSMPRKLKFTDGKMIQYPIHEILSLRCDKKVFNTNISLPKSCNIEFNVESDFVIALNNVVLSYKNTEICLDLSQCDCGRTKRYIKDIDVKRVSIFIDESVMEIFISDGEYTMTSRFYDNEKDLFVRFEGINEIETYKMKGFKIE